jgi:hypothetical protein
MNYDFYIKADLDYTQRLPKTVACNLFATELYAV